MAERTVSIRLTVKDGEVVKRALMQLGEDGQKALKRIEASSIPASKGLLAINAASKEGKNFVREYAAQAGPLGTVLSSVGTGGILAAAGIGALVLGISKALNITKQALTDFDLIAKTAERIGVTTDALQELRFVASQSGTDQETFDTALEKFTSTIGNAARGTQSAVKIFDSLNIQLRDSAGNLKPVGALFGEVADRIAKMTDAQSKASVARELFGRSGVTLVNTLNLGSNGIEELSEKAREFGLVIDEYVLHQAENAGDRIDALSKSVDVRLKNAFVKLSPIFILAKDQMAGFAETIGSVVGEIDYLIRGFDALSNVEIRSKLAETLRKEISLLNERQALEEKPIPENVIAQSAHKNALESINSRINKTKSDAKELMDILVERGLQASVSAKGTLEITTQKQPSLPTGNEEDTNSDYNGLAYDKALRSIQDKIANLQLRLAGQDKEAFVQELTGQLDGIGENDPRYKQFEEQARSLYDLQKAYEEMGKAAKEAAKTDPNDKAVQSLRDQLDAQLKLNDGKERAVFIQKELDKLDDKATQSQRDAVTEAAGKLYDEQVLQKQKVASDSIVANNKRVIDSLQEEIRYQTILIEKGQEAAEVYRSTGQLALDTTGLQTEAVEAQRKQVEALVAQLKQLHDIQEAKQLTEEHLDPKIKFDKEISHLKELLATGELSSQAFAAEYEQAYRRMLTASDDAWAGMERAALRFQDTIGTVADQTERLFSSLFDGIHDTLTDLIADSKFDLDSLLNTLKRSFASELAGSITSGISASFTNLGAVNNSGTFGSSILSMIGGLFGGKRHDGGSVQAGTTYLIGRNGAEEYFTPAVSGRMTPAGDGRDWMIRPFDPLNIPLPPTSALPSQIIQQVTKNSSSSHTKNVTQGASIQNFEVHYHGNGSKTVTPGPTKSRRQILRDIGRSLAEM